MDYERCGCNQVGGTQTYPCKSRVDALRRDLRKLDECLLAAAQIQPMPPRPRPRPCCCCCCCYCCRPANTGGNQTTFGR